MREIATITGHSLRRGREVLTFHIEGMENMGEPFPKLREVAEIKADPEFADDSADATVAVVDVDLPARADRVNISIGERVLQRADRAADAADETRSGCIATALMQRLAGPADDDSPVHQSRRSKRAIGKSSPLPKKHLRHLHHLLSCYQKYYNRASEHPSVYVIEGKRLS